MTKIKLQRLHKLLTELQHELEDTNKEAGRTMGRAKDLVSYIYHVEPVYISQGK